MITLFFFYGEETFWNFFWNFFTLHWYLELSLRDQVGTEQRSSQQSWSDDDVLGLIEQSQGCRALPLTVLHTHTHAHTHKKIILKNKMPQVRHVWLSRVLYVCHVTSSSTTATQSYLIFQNGFLKAADFIIFSAVIFDLWQTYARERRLNRLEKASEHCNMTSYWNIAKHFPLSSNILKFSGTNVMLETVSYLTDSTVSVEFLLHFSAV